MAESTRERLNLLYRPIVDTAKEILSFLPDQTDGFTIESGFYNGHFHKGSDGQYQADLYPIWVIEVKGLCDIEIDFDAVSVTAKLTREQILTFDWRLSKGLSFEVYGVEHYLDDYGDSQNTETICRAVQDCAEKAFFLSFSFAHDAKKVVRFLTFLKENGFYY